MATTILYMSHHGTTESVAHEIAELLNDDTSVINLRDTGNPDLAAADTVLIGGSIHYGTMQKGVRKFCARNSAALLSKQLGLFMCSGQEPDGDPDTTAEKEFTDAFPEELRDHAHAIGLFGGEYVLENMNFVEKFIVRKVAKVTESSSNLDHEAIRDFAGRFNNPKI